MGYYKNLEILREDYVMEMISGRQAAKAAGMRYATFMEYVHTGEIPARRANNVSNWEIPEPLLHDWIDSRKAEAVEEAIAQAEVRKKEQVYD